jgi:DNA-binding transcriptional MerR regulator
MKDVSIGKVCKIVDLPQSVLRYWETVFDVFKPYKSPGGTRRYSESDIELILEIKDLLYNKKYTIAGANSKLAKNRQAGEPAEAALDRYPDSGLQEIVDELESILNDLAQEGPAR